MPETGKPQPHLQVHLFIAVADLPLLTAAFFQDPFPFFGIILFFPENSLCTCRPLFRCQRFVPYRLRFGAYQHLAAETFQFLKIAGIQQFVVFPVLGGEQFYHIPGIFSDPGSVTPSQVQRCEFSLTLSCQFPARCQNLSPARKMPGSKTFCCFSRNRGSAGSKIWWWLKGCAKQPSQWKTATG